MSAKCLFRGKWTEEKFGCIYHNEPNSLTFRDECPYKDEDVEKCEKYMKKESNK